MVGESNKNNKKSGSEQIDLDTAATVIGWYVDWGQRWDDTVIDVHNRECWSWLTSSGHSLSSYTGDSDSAAPTMLSNKTISLSENIWYQQKNILLSSFKEKVLCKLNLLFHLKKGWNYIFFVWPPVNGNSPKSVVQLQRWKFPQQSSRLRPSLWSCRRGSCTEAQSIVSAPDVEVNSTDTDLVWPGGGEGNESLSLVKGRLLSTTEVILHSLT